MKNENHNGFEIPVNLGVTADGKELSINIIESPNLLVAGKGPAKDSMIDQLIGSVIESGSPEDVRIIVTNLGDHSLEQFSNDPHLLASIQHRTVPSKGVLDYLCNETEHRVSLFSMANAHNLSEYNAIVSDNPAIGEHLQYLVYVIDDFSCMMQRCRPWINRQIKRICAVSSLVGVHLVLGVETVSSDVITGTVISNFPSQICFRVDGRYQSRMVLDHDGAEKLGDDEFLYCHRGDPELNRVRRPTMPGLS